MHAVSISMTPCGFGRMVYRAECDGCGWKGPDRTNAPMATVDGGAHMRRCA